MGYARKAQFLTVKNGDIKAQFWEATRNIPSNAPTGESNLASNPNDAGKPLTISANNGDVAIQFQPSTQP